MKLKALFISAGAVAFINIGAAILNFGSNVLVSRLFGEGVYAHYSFITTLITILSTILTLGLGNYLLITLPKAQAASWGRLVSSSNTLIVGFFLLAIFPIIIYLQREGYTGIPIALVVFSLASLMASYIRQPVYYAWSRPIYYQCVDKFIRVCVFVVSMILMNYVFNIEGLLLILLSLSLSYSVPNVVFWLDGKRHRLDFFSLGKPLSFKEVGKTSKLFVILVTTTMLTNIDILIMKNIASQELLAYYSAAQKISLVGNMFLMALSGVATPAIVRFQAVMDTQLKGYVKYISLFGFVSLLLYLCAMLVFGKLLLSIFGKNFEAAYTALILLSVAIAISGFFGQTLTLMKVYGNFNAAIFYLLFALFVKLILICLFYKLGVLTVVACSTVSSVIIWNSLCALHLYFRNGVSSSFFWSKGQ